MGTGPIRYPFPASVQPCPPQPIVRGESVDLRPGCLDEDNNVVDHCASISEPDLLCARDTGGMGFCSGYCVCSCLSDLATEGCEDGWSEFARLLEESTLSHTPFRYSGLSGCDFGLWLSAR
jgi:hypothetical protein